MAFFRPSCPLWPTPPRRATRLFLPFNALGGLTWGVGFVLLGFLAVASYEAVAKAAGRDITADVAVLVVVVRVVWRVRRSRLQHPEGRERAAES